jgi:hypothetical protein
MKCKVLVPQRMVLADLASSLHLHNANKFHSLYQLLTVFLDLHLPAHPHHLTVDLWSTSACELALQISFPKAFLTYPTLSRLSPSFVPFN